MDAQHKFNQLFEQLQAEVAKLLKQKASLSLVQDVATAEARLVYLRTAIADLEAKQTKSEQDTADILAANAERLAEDRQKLQQLQAEYDAVQCQVVAGEQAIATMQRVTEEESKRLDASIREKQQTMAAIEAGITTKQGELQLVQMELADSRQAAAVLDEQVTKKTQQAHEQFVAADAELHDLDKHHADAVARLEAKQAEITQIGQVIDTKKQELADYDAKLTEFKAYEARAMKALEVKETALLEREAALVQKERRKQPSSTSILDNL